MLSKGEYITTIDSDDYYTDKEKLEKEIELIMEHKQKHNMDIIAFSNIIVEQLDGARIAQGNDTNIVQGKILNRLLTRDCMIPRDFVFHRSLYFDVGGYDTTLPIYEDWDFKIRIAARHEYHYTGIAGTAYRIHGTGLSNTKIPVHIKYLNKVFRKNSKLISPFEKTKVEEGFKNFIQIMKNEYTNKLSDDINNNIRNREITRLIVNYFSICMHDGSFLNPKQFVKLIRGIK